MKRQFRFSGFWEGEQVVAHVNDLNTFLLARPEECVCVTRYELGEGDCLELVRKGDVNWQSVD